MTFFLKKLNLIHFIKYKLIKSFVVAAAAGGWQLLIWCHCGHDCNNLRNDVGPQETVDFFNSLETRHFSGGKPWQDGPLVSLRDE